MKQDFAAKLTEERKLEYQNGFEQWLKTQNPGWYKISIVEKKDIRSLRQNAYWWGLLIPMCVEPINKYRESKNEEPFNDKQISDTLKLMFGLKGIEKRAKFDDKKKKVVLIEEEFLLSTADYSKTEFKDLWEKVYQFMSETFNVYIPDPDPKWKNNQEAVKNKVIETFDGEII